MPPSPKPETPPRSLEARIYAVQASLSPAEKKLAEVLLQHQAQLPNTTAGQLARKAGVSKATAARLIRALGYASYPEAKRMIREDPHWGSPRAGLADPDHAPTGSPAIARTVEADLDNIRATVAALPQALLDEVGRAIAGAPRLWIMGLRSGHGLAQHAEHYFSLARGDVQVLEGASLARNVAAIGQGDVLLVIAFRRRPRLLPTILAEARAAGAVAILITDMSAAASAKAATHVLRCRCQSPSPFNSFAAAVTLINYLAWSITVLLGEQSLARFRRLDRLVELFDDVSTPQSRR